MSSQQNPDYRMTKTADSLASFRRTEVSAPLDFDSISHSPNNRVIDVTSQGVASSSDEQPSGPPQSVEVVSHQSWDQRIDKLRNIDAHAATPRVAEAIQQFAHLGFMERRIALDLLDLVTHDDFAAEKKKMFRYAAADMSGGRGLIDEKRFEELSAQYEDLKKAYQELEGRYNRLLSNKGTESAQQTVRQRFDTHKTARQVSTAHVVDKVDTNDARDARDVDTGVATSDQSQQVDEENVDPIPSAEEEEELVAQDSDDDIDDDIALPEGFDEVEMATVEDIAQQKLEEESERKAEALAEQDDEIPDDGPEEGFSD